MSLGVVASPSPPITLIKPRRGLSGAKLAELWRSRDLLLLMALRDIKVRYKQTVLGGLWAVLQPLISMVVLTLVFGGLMGVDKHAGDTPYPAFLYSGLVLWTCFAAVISTMSRSLVGNATMLQKIYLPRLILPLASIGAPLLDFAIAATIMLGICLIFGVGLNLTLLLTPIFLALALVAATGVGLLLAGLTVTYRDFRYVVPFLIQTWFFLTPVIAPVDIVPEAYRWIAALNPAAGPIEAFRASVLGQPIDYQAVAVSAVAGFALLTLGLAYFHKVERRFADIV